MEGVDLYYNQMHNKWCINHSEGFEFLNNKKEALKKARSIAKDDQTLMKVHESEDNVKEKDYTLKA